MVLVVQVSTDARTGTEDMTATFALASIPLFGFIHFTGILCFIRTKEKEYYLCTYNGAKLKKVDEDEIIITREEDEEIPEQPGR